jgi:orotate phosphoribosyltransferase
MKVVRAGPAALDVRLLTETVTDSAFALMDPPRGLAPAWGHRERRQLTGPCRGRMATMSDTLARRVHHAAHLTGTFRLRSGLTSTEYFDKYLFESDPRLLRDIAEGLAPLVPAGIDALAGLDLGGVPVVTVLSQVTLLPALFVRKKAKDYGTCRLAEGGDVAGRRLLVVEDVVTTGGQVLESCAELRALGARVETVVCVIDREAGGTEAFAAEGLELRALFTMSMLNAAGLNAAGS